MKIDASYSEIIKQNSRESIFNPGPYNHCAKANRIYLDELDEEIKTDLQLLTTTVLNKISKLFKDSFFVCLVTFTQEKSVFFPKEDLTQLTNCGIPLPIEFQFEQTYIELDEWYANYLFFKESKTSLKRYVKGILATYLSENEPYINLDVFFISNNLEKLVNLYDDRGMDIVELKTKPNKQ